MKDAFYFSHDYNARSDPKLRALMTKQGLEGIGIYWCLIEMLYEQDGYLKLDTIDGIAFELHSDCDRINSVLKNFGLFKFKKDLFFSDSVLRRIKARKIKSQTNRANALTRWNKIKYNDANALRPQSDRNAIKGKDIKGNKKEYKEKKIPSFSEASKDHGDFVRFNNYLSVHAPNVLKMEQPFSEEEFYKLKKDFSVQFIENMVVKMHNYKPLKKNNVSANLTFRNWANREQKGDAREIKTETPSTYKLNPIDNEEFEDKRTARNVG